MQLRKLQFYTISVLGSTLTFHLVYGSTTTTDNDKINALELFSWLKAVLTPVNIVSTSKVLEVSKEHAQRKPQAAYCRGFSRGVKKPNTQQTSHAKVFVNAKSHATGAPNENIVQNHLHISIVKRIIVFKQ